jgi:hypothetical protein
VSSNKNFFNKVTLVTFKLFFKTYSNPGQHSKHSSLMPVAD